MKIKSFRPSSNTYEINMFIIKLTLYTVNKYLWNNLYTLNKKVDVKFKAHDIEYEKKLKILKG